MSIEAWICIVWATLSLVAFVCLWAAGAINGKGQEHE